jgi:hypothetical protein
MFEKGTMGEGSRCPLRRNARLQIFDYSGGRLDRELIKEKMPASSYTLRTGQQSVSAFSSEVATAMSCGVSRAADKLTEMAVPRQLLTEAGPATEFVALDVCRLDDWCG